MNEEIIRIHLKQYKKLSGLKKISLLVKLITWANKEIEKLSVKE